MCWAFRVADADGVVADNSSAIASRAGRIVRSGQEGVALVKSKGRLTWMPHRYGMIFPKAGGGTQLIWNAREDKLDTVDSWTRLIRQRVAVPVDAYVENAPTETWLVGERGWMVGFFNTDRDGGMVFITGGDGEGRRPVIMSTADALTWLHAEQWDVRPHLAKAPRFDYREADLFESKRLSADARTTVPLPKAA